MTPETITATDAVKALETIAAKTDAKKANSNA
jgi:hypothetical protein